MERYRVSLRAQSPHTCVDLLLLWRQLVYNLVLTPDWPSCCCWCSLSSSYSWGKHFQRLEILSFEWYLGDFTRTIHPYDSSVILPILVYPLGVYMKHIIFIFYIIYLYVWSVLWTLFQNVRAGSCDDFFLFYVSSKKSLFW